MNQANGQSKSSSISTSSEEQYGCANETARESLEIDNWEMKPRDQRILEKEPVTCKSHLVFRVEALTNTLQKTVK